MRRRTGLLLIAVTCSAAVGWLVTDAVSSQGAPAVSSLRSLSLASRYDSLVLSGNGLALSDCDAGASAAIVEPQTLELRKIGCSALTADQRIGLMDVRLASAGAVGSCAPESLGARAVRFSSHGAAVSSGPILFSFAGGCSQTQPRSTSVGDSLWVYDCTVGPHGSGGEMVELSLITAEVEASVAMAGDCWTSLGADRDGAFVASYANGGDVYFVASRTHRAVAVLRSSGHVAWIYGSGTSAYVDVASGGQGSCAPISCGIWALTGTHATPHLLARGRTGFELLPPTGNPSVGLFSATEISSSWPNNGPARYELEWISPSGGVPRSIATFQVPSYLDDVELEYVDQALFVFDGQSLDRYLFSY